MSMFVKVTIRREENQVLFDTHPLSPEEAMDLARRLAIGAQKVRAYQDERRKKYEPPPLETLPAFDAVAPIGADIDGEIRTSPEPEIAPPPAASRMPPRRPVESNEIV
jgi:hypothetical protein